jgi:hypothetical protein
MVGYSALRVKSEVVIAKRMGRNVIHCNALPRWTHQESGSVLKRRPAMTILCGGLGQAERLADF